MQNFVDSVKGKRITVMGLGLLGRGLGDTLFLIECGARVTVTDLKTSEQLAPSLAKLEGLPVTIKVGGHDEQDFISADMILRNADVPQHSPFLKLAEEHGVPIEMDESLFCKFFSGLVVGITGTRGKTTTTSLVYNILKSAGRRVHLAGNIMGMATLPLLKVVGPQDVVTLELSSWQLQGFHRAGISPQASVFTNIYPDHLNRYSGMDEYIEDKTAIYKYQKASDFCVFNKDNPVTSRLAGDARSKVSFFSMNDAPKNWDIKLPGDHNLENVAAAVITARLMGVRDSVIREAVETFQGVRYRLESLGIKKEVEFINDTTSTTPVSGIAALKAYRNREILLIAGGADKKLDLTDFAKVAAQMATRIALLEGSATPALNEKLLEYGASSKIDGIFSDLKSAVLCLLSNSRPGQVLLFSPACASFGMFNNEFHRGETFLRIFEEL